MTDYENQGPVDLQFDGSWEQQPPWVQAQWRQLEGRFRDFLSSIPGRFYALYGGSRTDRSTMLQTIYRRFPPQPAEPSNQTLSVLIDLLDTPDSTGRFFRHLFQEMRRQLDVCHIDPHKADRWFEQDRYALDDFGDAFDDMVQQPESKIHTARRIVLLLDNGDALAQSPEDKALFRDLVSLYFSRKYERPVTSKLDIIVAGGVPLYNRLSETRFASPEWKHWYYLEALPADAARALIVHTLPVLEGRPDLIDQSLRYTGGHPYTLTCFLEQLGKVASSTRPLPDGSAEQAAMACLQSGSELSKWFFRCLKAVREQGAEAAYAALVIEGAMKWDQILASVAQRQPAAELALRDPEAGDRALDMLLLHGLVRRERIAGVSQYGIANQLFRDWFAKEALPIIEDEAELAQYDIATIRRLVIDSFTAKDLRRFCQDRPTFEPILDYFGPDFSFIDMVDAFIERCKVRRLFSELLNEIREYNPKQYERYFPTSD